MEYEYEPEMEELYRQSLLKSFKKQVDNLYFNFIIIDAVFSKVKQFEEFWSYAKSKGFQVYSTLLSTWTEIYSSYWEIHVWGRECKESYQFIEILYVYVHANYRYILLWDSLFM